MVLSTGAAQPVYEITSGNMRQTLMSPSTPADPLSGAGLGLSEPQREPVHPSERGRSCALRRISGKLHGTPLRWGPEVLGTLAPASGSTPSRRPTDALRTARAAGN